MDKAQLLRTFSTDIVCGFSHHRQYHLSPLASSHPTREPQDATMVLQCHKSFPLGPSPVKQESICPSSLIIPIAGYSTSNQNTLLLLGDPWGTFWGRQEKGIKKQKVKVGPGTFNHFPPCFGNSLQTLHRFSKKTAFQEWGIRES